jgi:hypothetical protein
VERYGLDMSVLGKGTVMGCYKHCNEPLGSIKGREFLDLLRRGHKWLPHVAFTLLLT